MAEILKPESLLDFKEILVTHPRVVVDFHALSWCVPCQRLHPHFVKAAEQSDATFVEVDVDESGWATVEYGVRGVPTVMLFEDGRYVKTLVGRTVLQILNELKE